ncbi:hypothetical protein METBIDRAFT_34590 [Metschnikowia bicuspidata var. bicuspidata NRRL YB-4993]|uniref:Fe2OG dioxygenase domain-containing protein n=1 Tax=Metschnikowia bicuspidata var. bicuspidata NRRL YB-4993 TaxID=869754 RepID=A0A1A0HJ25_9ASCO|nr:hypothetical protein METBIDRAFT_34590 [Metschnikowia bicuspidata var. bicuspidata NRRL YB-4993]OBA23887.1 hypothetical protein METBIDRAFT_34590 [Metschnikowia bicuspidata var. bicuspidata NRRL YB-4993]
MAQRKQRSVSEELRVYDFPQNLYTLNANFKSSFFKPVPESVVENQIITIEHFFTDEFCNELITDFSNKLTLETTPLIKSREYAARHNDRVSVTSLPAADALWKYLRSVLMEVPQYDASELDLIRQIFKNAKSLNPQLRIYRYIKGHHFGKHYDESVSCPLAHDAKIKGKTKWTLLIYLTGDDEFSGGGTIFHPEIRDSMPLNIHPSKGMALLHKHGDDCLKHEAEIVRSGVKWVLRSDVTY